MANVIRCDCCQGRKQIKGLGNMEKDCPACRGIGWIDGKDKDLEQDLMEVMKPKKKPGRKPKLENTVQC
jgi:hypothetical protein